jgi:hypothetical protein
VGVTASQHLVLSELAVRAPHDYHSRPIPTLSINKANSQ